MADAPQSQRAPTRGIFLAVRHSLVASAFMLALVAGCGGSPKPADSPAAGAGGSAPPASASTPVPADTGAAPAAGTPAVAAGAADLGSKVFVQRCVLCHGADGRGDGIASKGLKPQPRNFHDQAYMNTRTDAQLLEIIHKGKGAMPRWEGQLSEAEITAVLAHIRELGKRP